MTMRKTLLAVLAAVVMLWAATALAYFRPIAVPSCGDPDEYESCRLHDEAEVRLGGRQPAGGGSRKTRVRPGGGCRVLTGVLSGTLIYLDEQVLRGEVDRNARSQAK
jgi:hypothetical protein